MTAGVETASAQGERFLAAQAATETWEVQPDTQERVLAAELVEAPGSPWLRVQFGRVQLPTSDGVQAYLRMTSLLDGGEQRLTAAQLEEWTHLSAYFNGPEVLVELVVPAGAEGKAQLTIDGAVTQSPAGPDKSICGDIDDRSVLEHPAIARVMPIKCTAWLIDTCNKCLVTAGHCTNGSAGVVQFNVPPSLADGTPVFPPPEHQYAVDGDETLSTGLGDPGTEFGLMQVYANPNTGLMPYDVQNSAFALSDQLPQSGTSVAVAGYGTDETLQIDPGVNNFVLRTHSGEIVRADEQLIEYRTDTTGGNSGSPVIDDATGKVVAIHTHGGCSLTEGNRGTSTNRLSFRDAIGDLTGPCVCPGLAINPISQPGDVLLPRHPGVVAIEVVNPGSGQVEVDAQNVALHWSVDSGSTGTVYMDDLGGGAWVGKLPPIECGEVIRYWVTAEADGASVRWPRDEQSQLWAVAGWRVFEFASFDFEQDPAWTVTAPSSAKGEWGIGVPSNEPQWLTPPADADGSGNCWLTGVGTGNNDVDGGPVRLITRWFAPAEGEAIVLSYARYFANDDRDDVLEIEVQESLSPWQMIESVSTDPLWRTVRAPVRSSRGKQHPFRVRFSVADDPNNSITEAAIDAFVIQSVSCDVACAADINGDGVVDFDDFLEWLNLVGTPFSRGDLNGDGVTDFLDFQIMLAQYLRECRISGIDRSAVTSQGGSVGGS